MQSRATLAPKILSLFPPLIANFGQLRVTGPGPDGDLALGDAIGCFRTGKTFGILAATEST
jgi:hypothetical protein